MEKLGLNEIREKYLRFFESKGHLRLPSFSLVPVNDTSLLLINSGMAPLKPYFIGKETPPKKRVTTCQKCIRTPDIENVGKTARHGTFFEMLGNFSFGDYFKKEATTWAWEFITKELQLPVDRLWVSIYENDDEAFEIWTKVVGVSPDRIVRLGKEDNFWEIGTGPCGPCSEIYFDLGEERGCKKKDCKVGCDCDRYIEFWNLVFTQFNKTEDGEYKKLANPNIDTGMGLERLACIMQDVNNLFEVDTVKNILNYVCDLANVKYGEKYDIDVSIRVITDHIRSTVMLISDGVLPSNEGRGYVLRRLIRRAARHGKLLGLDGVFLNNVADVVINESQSAYKKLEENRDYIKNVIRIEEEKFQQTIEQGIVILSEYIDELKKDGKTILGGEKVFKLHDTFGFPIDLTREILREHDLDLDQEAFNKEMKNQKEKARKGMKDKEGAAWSESFYSKLDNNIKTSFSGYETLEDDGRILYIVRDQEFVDSASVGDSISIILDKTPFYATSGGQVADSGYIVSGDAKVRIDDVKKTQDGKFIHIGIVEEGEIGVSKVVKLLVDKERRENIERNHTVTHLLQRALKNILGEHVNQAGSLVDDKRLRFDFNHFNVVTKEELWRVEDEVNRKICEDLQVLTINMNIKDAKKLGAMALFDEKYGDIVRVVKIGNYSIELCGGTHLKSTAKAGLVKIISQTGVASGVRRIEAITGISAINYYKDKEEKLDKISSVLKTDVNDSLKKAEILVEDLRKSNKEIEKLRGEVNKNLICDIVDQEVYIKGIRYIVKKLEGISAKELRDILDMIKNKMDSVFVVLASIVDDRIIFASFATKDLVQRGIHAGNVLKEIAKITKGGGGGRPDLAQAGGTDIGKLDDALKIVDSILEKQLKK